MTFWNRYENFQILGKFLADLLLLFLNCVSIFCGEISLLEDMNMCFYDCFLWCERSSLIWLLNFYDIFEFEFLYFHENWINCGVLDVPTFGVCECNLFEINGDKRYGGWPTITFCPYRPPSLPRTAPNLLLPPLVGLTITQNGNFCGKKEETLFTWFRERVRFKRAPEKENK